jgi:PadR family transcriptional regulator, regulatory protein PadR
MFPHGTSCCFPKGNVADFMWETQRAMKAKTDVRQGTLALMVLKTLDVLGPLHGYGIARRIEQISGDLTLNQGTLYPVLLKLEQEGSVASEWGASENNRKARFYRLTRDGHRRLKAEARDWEQTAAIIGRFFRVRAEDLE